MWKRSPSVVVVVVLMAALGCASTDEAATSAPDGSVAAGTTSVPAPAFPLPPAGEGRSPEATPPDRPSGTTPEAVAPGVVTGPVPPDAPLPTGPATTAAGVAGWPDSNAGGPPPTSPSGARCPTPPELAGAYLTAFPTRPPLGSGLIDVSCTDRWVTARTSPDVNGPGDNLPALVLFGRDGGAWVALAAGTSNDCAAHGVSLADEALLECA